MLRSLPALLLAILALVTLAASRPLATTTAATDPSERCICDESRERRPSLTELIKRVKPAVVTVHVYNEDGEVVSQGSGWFLTERVVVSTRHTFWKDDLLGAAYAKVTTNSPNAQQYLVKSVLVDDRAYDLVLLEVLPVVPRGANDRDSDQIVLEVNVDLPEEGEDVFVISSPLGLPGVISPGIVSAMHNDYDLQISSPVSTGSSGAPILDFSGKVVGIVTGHLSTGQNLNFGLTVRALAAVIAKLRPILHERPLTLELPAPRRSPTSTTPPASTRSRQDQVQVYQNEKDMPTQPVPNGHDVVLGTFDKEIDELERQRGREWCYPTLSEWVNSQNARRQEQGAKKWWRGWKRFLAGLFSSNATDEDETYVLDPLQAQSSVVLEALPAHADAGTGTTVVDNVQSQPQTPAIPSKNPPASSSKQNHTARGYSPEVLLEDIASLRLCTTRRPSPHLSSLTEHLELSVSEGDGDDEDAREDLDKH